jgi:HsdM N-terminal domain
VTNFGEYVSFIWNVADLLRGPYRPNQYGRVILPMTVLRRLDCVLEPTKEKVLRKAAELKGQPESLVEKLLQREAKQKFFNTSKYTFERLAADPNGVSANLTRYIKGFSRQAREILDKFGVEAEIAKLEERNLLYCQPKDSIRRQWKIRDQASCFDRCAHCGRVTASSRQRMAVSGLVVASLIHYASCLSTVALMGVWSLQ